MRNPFRYFNSSPEVIRLTVMMYVRYPLSLRQVEDLLHERGLDICHETVRFWWNRFGPMFAAEIRKLEAQGLEVRLSSIKFSSDIVPSSQMGSLETRPDHSASRAARELCVCG